MTKLGVILVGGVVGIVSGLVAWGVNGFENNLILFIGFDVACGWLVFSVLRKSLV